MQLTWVCAGIKQSKIAGRPLIVTEVDGAAAGSATGSGLVPGNGVIAKGPSPTP